MPNGTNERIKIFSDTLPLKVGGYILVSGNGPRKGQGHLLSCSGQLKIKCWLSNKFKLENERLVE